jgi:phage portal protein BeeE
MATLWQRLAAVFGGAPSGAEVLGAALAEARSAAKPEAPEVALGSDFHPAPVAASYNPAVAMSAIGADPWTFAALTRTGFDLARLPLRVSREGRRKDQLQPRHPFLDLMARPAPGWSGYLLRAQWTVDHRATGDAFGLKLYAGERWTGILRLPPQSVRPIASGDGVVREYVYRHGGVERVYPRSAIIHIRGVSWADGPEGFFSGTGMIEPLHRTIDTSLKLGERINKASKQGRPGAIAYPSVQPGAIPPNAETVAEARKTFRALLRDASGGAAFLGMPIEWKAIDWSPQELQAAELDERLIQTRIAVSGVPPVRLGRDTTNYATARQQAEVYWGDELQAEAELIDAELTHHVQMEFGDDTLAVWHDFSSVPALQETRTLALQRVSLHILNGMLPADAYAYEGMEEAPITNDVALDVPAATGDAPALSADLAAHVRAALPDEWEAHDRVGALVHDRVVALARGATDDLLAERRTKMIARLASASDLAGAIACAHWLVVPTRGEAWVRRTVDEEVARQGAEAEASAWWTDGQG